MALRDASARIYLWCGDKVLLSGGDPLFDAGAADTPGRLAR